jgi:hypothetical protein
MAAPSASARTVAQRLLARGGAPGAAATDPPDLVAATDEVCRQLAYGLTRWFGPFGYHALLSRALAQARSGHPALHDVNVRSAAEPSLEGLTDSVARHGTDATTEGIVATLMAFIELLGRLIGEDMAHKLIDQSVRGQGADADEPHEGRAP